MLDFDLTDSEREWLEEVRAFLGAHLTDELKAEVIAEHGPDAGALGGPHTDVFTRQLAAKGWNVLDWPEEYGGLAKGAMCRMLLTEEFEYAGAPKVDFTPSTFGPLIMRYGTEENKREWIPKIRAGEVNFALGYSEPQAGSDLASLRTRAVLDGDEWVINGQKIWNTGAHACTHEWLAVRTDPEAAPHKGISIIIVPIDTEGLSFTPIECWGDVRTNQVFFEDVRVPRQNLIGEVNRGWSYIVGALDNERATMGSPAVLRRLLDDLVAECGRTELDGAVLTDRPEVRRELALLDMQIEIAQLMSIDIASSMDGGLAATVPATMQKVMTSELRTRLADVGMALFGLRGQLLHGDPGAPLDGGVELTYRRAPYRRFGGGANEILRDVIAQRGFGLPRFGRR